MSKQDLYSIIPIVGKKLIEKENSKNNVVDNKVTGTMTVEDILPFEDIYEDIVKISNGKYRAIVKTNAISLDDMDLEDKNLVLDIYADFISGLTKAHQVYVPSFTLDLRENETRLKKRYDEEDDFVREWIDDDIEFQKSLVEENDIIDTQFYIVFEVDFEKPNKDQSKDFLKAKKMLKKQVKFASDQLESIGLYIEQLNREDIGRLYYYSLNPFFAGVQEPNFENNMVAGLTIEGEDKKKRRRKNKNVMLDEDFDIDNVNDNKKETTYLRDGGITFKNKIVSYNVNDKESGEYIKLGSTYVTIYEIYDYPTNMSKLWAKKLYNFRENIDISMHVTPIKTSEITKELDRAAINYGSANIDAKTGEKRKATTTIQKKMERSSEDVDRIIDELDSGEQSLYHFSMYVLVKEKSLERLEETCLDLESVIGSMRVQFRKCSDNMRDALITVLPFGLDRLGTTRNMLTKGVANAFPFTNFSFTHKDGFFLGTHKYNQTLVNFNPFQLENANGSIMGCSGGGKSTVLKKIIKGLITTMDIKVRVVDPEGENIKFAEDIGATIIDYYVGSKDKINVFDLEPDDEIVSLIKPQINFVKIFLNKIMEIEKDDKSKIDYSLIKLYEKFGFTDDKETYWDDDNKNTNEDKFTFARKKRKAPELYDLYELWNSNELEAVIGDTRKLAADLREWTRLGSNDMFDGQTTADLSSKRIYFNLKHLDKSVKPAAIFVLFQKLWDLVRKNPLEYEAIINEEVHHLLRDDDMGEYIYELNKRIRKYGGASIYATQNITDFMKTKWGPEILKNCSWGILVKQNKKDIEPILECFEMTRSEAVKMTRFNRDKGEAYLLADKFRIPINVRLSNKEMRTFTTKTSDLIALSKEEENAS
jgi:type IV secretory pathway VirB4 component